ncbi:MAG: division/cell wall cluster transcriptional repressor MraZ [Armatimonadota bacterium]|nr:division/cell wall cluster transcriptional repressor MraZ [bacterium]
MDYGKIMEIRRCVGGISVGDATAMFGGSYTHSLDSAGRFVLPKKLRYELGEEFIITRGLGCLCVFPVEWKNKLEAQLNSLGSPLELLLNPHITRLHRHFFGEMVTASTDSQFRVMLTPEHRRYAGITEEVVIVGRGMCIELWSPEALAQYQSENDGIADLIASGTALLAVPINRGLGEQDAGISQTGPAR